MKTRSYELAPLCLIGVLALLGVSLISGCSIRPKHVVIEWRGQDIEILSKPQSEALPTSEGSSMVGSLSAGLAAANAHAGWTGRSRIILRNGQKWILRPVRRERFAEHTVDAPKSER